MSDSLTCIVVTPEQTALEQKAEFVSVPLYDGELGILNGRAPLIGRLGKGTLRVRQSNGTTNRYQVDGGFVQVQGNVVSLITESFMLPNAPFIGRPNRATSSPCSHSHRIRYGLSQSPDGCPAISRTLARRCCDSSLSR